jgi:enoyl-CoA hydratase
LAATEVMRGAVGPFAGTRINSADLLTPEQAQRYGLFMPVADASLLERALAEARRLARVPSATFRDTKEQLHRAAMQHITATTDQERRATLDGWTTEVENGGIAALLRPLARKLPLSPPAGLNSRALNAPSDARLVGSPTFSTIASRCDIFASIS